MIFALPLAAAFAQALLASARRGPDAGDTVIHVARTFGVDRGTLYIAKATVKAHRSRAIRKMKARSLSRVGRMADSLKVFDKLQVS
jgi:hypothetical protein